MKKSNNYSTPLPRALPGSDNKLSNSQIVTWLGAEGFEAVSSYVSSGSPLTVLCPNKHLWNTTWDSIRNGYQCIHCLEQTRLDKRIKSLTSAGYVISGPIPTSAKDTVTLICIVCNTIKRGLVASLMRKTGCTTCNKSKTKARTILSYSQDVLPGYELLEIIANYGKRVRCPNGHTYDTWLSCSFCPLCSDFSESFAEFSRLGFTLEAKDGSQCAVVCNTCSDRQTVEFRYRKECALCCRLVNRHKKHEVYVAECAALGFDIITQSCFSVDQSIDIRCRAKNHKYTTTLYQLRRSGYCVHCQKTANVIKGHFHERMLESGWNYLSGVYENKFSALSADCIVCKTTYQKRYTDFINSGCLSCQYEKQKKWSIETATQYLASNKPHISLLSLDNTAAHMAAMLQCFKDGHIWNVNWYSFVSEGRDCPKCAGNIKWTWDGLVQAFSFRGYTVLDKELDRYNVDTKIQIRCPAGHEYKMTLHSFIGRECKYCSTLKTTSRWENEALEWLSNLGYNIFRSTREVIAPYSLDGYFPEHKLGIEFNGIYYHSLTIRKNKNYHLRKYELSRKAGVFLFQFWEDEWHTRKDVVKSMILAKLGQIERRVHARNCQVEEVGNREVSKFLEDNHLLGSTIFQRALGLRHDGELVALVTVSPSKMVGRHEITRFCTKLRTSVTGGFSKLVSKLPRPLVTYSDNRYSTGHLYDHNGFKLDALIDPSYELMKNNSRYSRRSISAKHGIDGIAGYLQNKYHLLYDAGKMRWILE